MKSRFLRILLTLTLLVSLFPIHALGAEKITINEIAQTNLGQTVQLNGNTSLSELIVKIYQPNGTLLYIDQIKPANGKYSLSFKLPSSAKEGDYKVQIGRGTTIATKEFTAVPSPDDQKQEDDNGGVKPVDPDPGNENNEGTPPTTNPPNPGTTPDGGGTPAKQSVTLSVHGVSGTIFSSQQVDFKTNDTPYSVLIRALGASVQASGSGSTVYVNGIAGLREFDHGPLSGWLFFVNNISPSESAGAVTLNPGDRVEWKYTKDGGNDLGVKEAIKGGAPTTGGGTLSKDQEDALKDIKLPANNKTPLKDTTEPVINVIKKDTKMTAEKIKQLKETLQKNKIQLSETVQPGQAKTIADKENEVSLIIPADALATQTTISVQKQIPSRPEVVSAIYTFGPKGLKFKEPVFISIQAPLEVADLSQLALVWLDETTNEWIPIPAVIDASTGVVTGLVDHFTQFAVIDRNKLSLTKRDVSANINKTVDHISKRQAISDWEAFALYRAGANIPASYLPTVEKTLTDNQGSFRKVTDLERMVLGVSAAGADPKAIAGYNLIEKIYNHENLTAQGTNGAIFALIALDSKNYDVPSNAKWDRTKLIDWLLDRQNKDGGWPLGANSDSSIDITAMALSALAPYQQEQPNVSKAIEKAIEYLSATQLKNGGYEEFGETSSESIAQVIQGLSALGVNSLDARFVKADGDLLSALLSYQQADGGFAHIKGNGTNPMATEQALAALVAYDLYTQGKGSIYQLAGPAVSQPTIEEARTNYVDDAQIADWAKDAVYRAHDLKIMSGTNADIPMFEPKNRLTRAQFVTLLHHVLDETPAEAGNSTFADVVSGSWYDGYVTGAYSKGWVQGVSTDSFAPNASITRQDLAVMLNNALHLETATADGQIKDLTQAKDYAKASITAVYANKFMVGYDGYFQPNDFVTREMAAVVAMKLVDHLTE
ncbi:hypothetical protein BEP19_13565 [Ammoniphilus oxalaticus]|uniref:SLH domain-containing protein n=1 Tax=Ammoniphilus oxalaticus TaxID=66863 RepID=A0A419SFC0_9BACL|nr:S-layer homology domain-containing protein [Ammoniphilus oxalaticus]RKD22092.1 hypothetical protein BEP19_13565 [Ammoniphilus oxalaticus]